MQKKPIDYFSYTYIYIRKNGNIYFRILRNIWNNMGANKFGSND